MDNTIFSNHAITNKAIIEYSIETTICHTRECFVFEDTPRFNDLCRTGCPNFACKWSCPPFAPSFESFSRGWERLVILFMHAEIKQFSYIKNDYLKIKAANSILKSRADKFLREMAKRHGAYISTGSCRLCKPCKRKLGQSCARPDLMTYSFEAMGIDVAHLVFEYFGKPLLWYKPHHMPEYTSVVCGLLTNNNISLPDVEFAYSEFINK